MAVPKPGDLVCATKSDDVLISVGSCGVVEGMAGRPRKEFLVTFNPSPLPWWESGAVTSSGGPAYWMKASRLKDTGRSRTQSFHKWGPYGPGPGQGDSEGRIMVECSDGDRVRRALS